MRSITVDRMAGTALAIFSLGVLWECRSIPFGSLKEPGPGALPVLLALALLICSATVAIAGSVKERLDDVDWTDWRQGLAILGACAFLALAFERIGYRLTIFIVLASLVKFVERKGWTACVVFAAGFAIITYYLFNTLLQVPLPRGPFGL